MSWVDLSRANKVLFRLKRDESYFLFVSDTLHSKGAKLFIEEDKISSERSLDSKEWKDADRNWSGLSGIKIIY